MSLRRRLREPVDEQGCTDGTPLDRCNIQVLVVGVGAAPLGTKSMELRITVESGTAQIDDLFVDPWLTKV